MPQSQAMALLTSSENHDWYTPLARIAARFGGGKIISEVNMTYDEIAWGLLAGVSSDVKKDSVKLNYYKQVITEYEAADPQNFNVFVQDNAKKLKAKLAGIKKELRSIK